jgi:hypothetical protein
MLNFLFTLEIVTISNAVDVPVDIDTDVHEVLALDEETALLTLKEQLEFNSEFFTRFIHSSECHGTLESETF